MNQPRDFQIAEDYACYRPLGTVSLQEAVASVSTVIKFCRVHKIKRLLVDLTKLTGFRPPNTFQRYELASRWARDARAAVKMAMVSTPEMLDPELFGVTVARNVGALVNAFTSETDALKWLLGEDGTEPGAPVTPGMTR